MIKLYDYYRSTACYRVRIALNFKNIAYEKLTIHLVNNGGEQHSTKYLQINPQGLVPTLNAKTDSNPQFINQSLAIIEYLEETYPSPALLPTNPWDRAQVRSLSFMIACEIHPVNNLRVLTYLRDHLKVNEQEIKLWYHHWLKKGFDAFEKRLQDTKQQLVCFGNTITMADLCLIPQVYNAERFDFPMSNYPCINTINKHCLTIAAFKNAAP